MGTVEWVQSFDCAHSRFLEVHMTVGWQKIRLPLLERLALAELAERRGESEEIVLARLVREAVREALATETDAGHGAQEVGSHDDASN
jgi:hypothetical protein